MFSVGILYAAQGLLGLIRDEDLSAEEFLDSFERYKIAKAVDVLETIQLGGWVQIVEGGGISLTDRGRAINSSPKEYIALRLQISDLIGVLRPRWAQLIPSGRIEAQKNFTNRNVEQCFNEAGLLGGYDMDVIEWWDDVAWMIRRNKDKNQVKTGRMGELLTIEYEEKRTGKKPEWVAIDSNKNGYDVLSIRGNDNDYPLRIEVKASSLPLQSAKFILTRHEWDTAKNGGYQFHLWNIMKEGDHKQYVLEHTDLEAHICHDRGRGTWKEEWIPFSIFKDKEIIQSA